MELVDKHIPRGPFTLAPVGDIQYGSQGCAEKLLRDHIDKAIANDWWLLGMGDYLDAMSPSNRRRMVAANTENYDSVRDLIDDAFQAKVSDLARLLAGTEGRWLGMIAGDHGWTLEDGQPCDALLAAKLKTRFLGSAAIVSVHAKGVDRPLRIFVTHGRGSSVSETGKTLHLSRLLAKFECDIVLMGHSHLLYGAPIDRIKSVATKTGPRLYAQRKIVGITGSFLKGYEENTSANGWPSGSYVEKAALPPVPLGALTINCEPVREEWGWEWNLSVTA